MNKCRICDNASDNRGFRVREMMFGTREEFDYFECSACGCLQIDEFPEDIARHYPRGYYSQATGLAAKTAYRFREQYALTGRSLPGRLVYRYFPNPGLRHASAVSCDSRVLDVGSGGGAMLDCMARNGYGDLTGIDPYSATEEARKNGVRLRKVPIEQLEGEWDLIMFNHSLEHVSDPLSALRTAGDLLAPGGRCLVRLPTTSSFAWRHYGVDWVQLDAPRHFFLFSTDSMEALASRAGMRISGSSRDSIPMQLWGSEQYGIDIPLFSKHSLMVNPFARTFSMREKRDFRMRTEELNRSGDGDQVALWLERDGA